MQSFGGRSRGLFRVAGSKDDKKVDAQLKTRREMPKKKGQRSEGDVGSALRAAYQNAVDETIPAEMLELLSASVADRQRSWPNGLHRERNSPRWRSASPRSPRASKCWRS